MKAQRQLTREALDTLTAELRSTLLPQLTSWANDFDGDWAEKLRKERGWAPTNIDLQALLKLLSDHGAFFRGHGAARVWVGAVRTFRNQDAHSEHISQSMLESYLAASRSLLDALGAEPGGIAKIDSLLAGLRGVAAPGLEPAPDQVPPPDSPTVVSPPEPQAEPTPEQLKTLFENLVWLLKQGKPHVVTYGWLYEWATGNSARGQGHYQQSQRWATGLAERRDAGGLTNLSLDSFVVAAKTKKPGEGHFGERRYSEAEWTRAFTSPTVLHRPDEKLPARGGE